MNLSRRNLLTGLTAFIAAPAIIRVAGIMPIKAWGQTFTIYPMNFIHGEINPTLTDLRPGPIYFVSKMQAEMFAAYSDEFSGFGYQVVGEIPRTLDV